MARHRRSQRGLSRAAVALVAALAVTAACSSSGDDDGGDGGGGGTVTTTSSTTTTAPTTTEPPPDLYDLACAGRLDVSVPGTLPADLSSVSGLAASERHPDLLWAIEDSLNPAQLVGVGLDGTVRATVDVDAGLVGNIDWEDVAVAPGPDGDPWVWIADTGDNFGVRTEREVLAFPEPALDDTTVDATTYRLRFDGARPDVEALAVVEGVVWVIDKPESGPATLYRAATDGEPDGPGTGDRLRSRYVLTPVTQLDLGDERVTGMDVVGSLLAVRTVDALRLYRIPDGGDLGDAVSGEPCTPPSPPERQGESVAILPEGAGLVTVSEDEQQSAPVDLHLVAPTP